VLRGYAKVANKGKFSSVTELPEKSVGFFAVKEGMKPILELAKWVRSQSSEGTVIKILCEAGSTGHPSSVQLNERVQAKPGVLLLK
jgi:hypothetical protein